MLFQPPTPICSLVSPPLLCAANVRSHFSRLLVTQFFTQPVQSRRTLSRTAYPFDRPEPEPERSFAPPTRPHKYHNRLIDSISSSVEQRVLILQDLYFEAGKMDAYKFPDYRLKKKMDDPSKTPLLLVACGSFSPITNLHLRMFVMAEDYVKFNTNFELVGGYLSPVSDAYKKQGLALAEHRVNMCQLAIDKAMKWLMVDQWEAEKKEYQPTAIVLDHFDNEVNKIRKGIDAGNGKRKQVRIALLAGADLIQTMSTPNVWSDKDIDYILGQYGTFIVERSGTDMDEALASLQQYRENIYIISQLIQNDVSSTKIRLFLKRGMSVQYLIPSPVIEYIEKNNLFGEDGRGSSSNLALLPEPNKGKEKSPVESSY